MHAVLLRTPGRLPASTNGEPPFGAQQAAQLTGAQGTAAAVRRAGAGPMTDPTLAMRKPQRLVTLQVWSVNLVVCVCA